MKSRGGAQSSQISIHALREEGDHCVYGSMELLDIISIHALREEGDPNSLSSSSFILDFYPRPPRGGRHGKDAQLTKAVEISIHALREEGDSREVHSGFSSSISIHALREEGDPRRSPAPSSSCTFLSTPSARRATAVAPANVLAETYFYPRPPRGGRPP